MSCADFDCRCAPLPFPGSGTGAGTSRAAGSGLTSEDGSSDSPSECNGATGDSAATPCIIERERSSGEGPRFHGSIDCREGEQEVNGRCCPIERIVDGKCTLDDEIGGLTGGGPQPDPASHSYVRKRNSTVFENAAREGRVQMQTREKNGTRSGKLDGVRDVRNLEKSR
jgi:hypothetical protein